MPVAPMQVGTSHRSLCRSRLSETRWFSERQVKGAIGDEEAAIYSHGLGRARVHHRVRPDA